MHPPAPKLLLILFLPTTSSFPLHFPPSPLTNSTLISPTQIADLTNPLNGIAWRDTDSPSILLCSAPDFHGTCQLLEHNAAKTCLNLRDGRHGQEGSSMGLGVEVGSVKIGGGAGCALFDRPACTGATVALLSKDSIRDLAVLRQIDHKNVMSLFCEPLREFSPWDLAGSLRGSSSDGDSSVRARYRSGGLKRSRRRVTAAVMPLFDGVGLDYQSGARAVLEAGETARDEWRDGMVERGEEEDSDDWKIDR